MSLHADVERQAAFFASTLANLRILSQVIWSTARPDRRGFMLPRLDSATLSARHVLVLLSIIAAPAAAQGRGGAQAEGAAPRVTWAVTQPRGQTRDIDFTTSEGTWTSADLSPDRTWI